MINNKLTFKISDKDMLLLRSSDINFNFLSKLKDMGAPIGGTFHLYVLSNWSVQETYDPGNSETVYVFYKLKEDDNV